MSRCYPVRGLVALCALLCLVACEAVKSANPTAPSATEPLPVATITAPPAVQAAIVRVGAPTALAPAGNLNTNNPDFLIVNGTIENASAVSYVFEVSMRADFSQIAAVVSVPLNETGNTMMSLGSLAYGQTLFWRVKATSGGTESDYSATLTFATPSGSHVSPWPDPNAASIESASWTTDRWRAYFFSLAAAKGGVMVSDEGMRAMRDDLLARGADFQNGWRGDFRPRLFLPVPGCPIANRRDVPACSYSRTVDLGSYGREWEWLVRF